MSLDMYYFDKNREFVTQTASIMEEAIREAVSILLIVQMNF